jgi:phosphonate transport system substrate-binding protein
MKFISFTLKIVLFSIPIFSILGTAEGQTKNSKNEVVYSVGIVPQFDSFTIRKKWNPILKELEKITGEKFKIKGSPTIPSFEREFESGSFDFAYMNPYHVLLASQSEGYIPLAKDIGRKLYGILVVNKNSPIISPQDLQGKEIVFPAPNALGASLMVRAALKDQFGITFQPRYVMTHTSVYLNVAIGESSAGGGVQKTLSRQVDDVKQNLRILYETEKVHPHPFVAHPRVPEIVREKVQNALLKIGESKNGKEMLREIPVVKIGKSSMEDYLPLKKYKFEKLIEKE